LDACTDDEQRRLVRASQQSHSPADPADESYGIGVLARLLDQAAERRVGSLRAALGEQQAADDPQRQNALLADLMAVEDYRRMLRTYWAGQG
jgi:hypothetical protein